MKSVLVVLFAIVVATLALPITTNPEFLQFVKWMKETGHKYHQADFDTRFSLWLQSSNRVNGKLNYFASYDKEEFTKYGCGLERLSDSVVPEGFVQPLTSFPATSDSLPKGWDWTKHGFNTPVKNQLDCSSCGVFSAVGAMEGVLAAKKNLKVSLSEQQMIDCNPSSQGCVGTYPALAFESTINAEPMKGGINAEADYTCESCFVWKQEKRDTMCKYYSDVKVATLTGYSQFCHAGSDACNEEQMASYLYNNGPMSVCLDMALFRDYTTGVVSPSSSSNTCSAQNINHCVTLVGYGEENGQKYWKIKNSFGENWGEQGYARIARGVSACGINQIVSAPLF